MDQFSNNELKKYADAKRMNKPYSVRCRKHTQACSLELTCSHCDERKPSRDFSNAQRKEVADRRRCRICVNYTETFDLFQNLPVSPLPFQRSTRLSAGCRTFPLSTSPSRRAKAILIGTR